MPEKETILKNAGYLILRFKGSEIKTDIDKCIEKIKGVDYYTKNST